MLNFTASSFGRAYGRLVSFDYDWVGVEYPMRDSGLLLALVGVRGGWEYKKSLFQALCRRLPVVFCELGLYLRSCLNVSQAMRYMESCQTDLSFCQCFCFLNHPCVLFPTFTGMSLQESYENYQQGSEFRFRTWSEANVPAGH